MAKQEYNVIVWDKPGTDRSKVRPQHVADIPASLNSGIVTSVGALWKDDARTQFAGSNLHLVAENREEIMEFLAKDVYAREGIWDLETVIINPIGVAARLPKVMDKVEPNLYKI